MRIFKFDVRTEALLRNEKTGRCIECGAGEAGELLGECGGGVRVHAVLYLFKTSVLLSVIYIGSYCRILVRCSYAQSDGSSSPPHSPLLG